MPSRDLQFARAILDSMSFPITSVDRDGTILHVNAEGARNLSGTLETLVGRSLFEFFPEREAATRERIRQTCERRAPQRFETVVTIPSGEEKYFDSVYYPTFDDFGEVIAVQIVSQDVTEQRRAALARKEKQDSWGLVTDDLSMTYERVKAVLETAPIVIGVHDADMTIRYMNWVVVEADMSKVVGSSPLSWIAEQDHAATRAAFAKVLSDRQIVEFRVHDIWGHVWLMRLAPLVHGGEVNQVLSCTLDVTDHRRMERQLWQKQKIESLGTLASGIAHDFNNLLAAIIGNVGLAERWLGTGRDPTEFLANINEASQKAAELCKQMLCYAGHGQTSLSPGDLNSIIEEMVRITRAAVSSRIQMTYDLAPDLPFIRCNATQLGQVALNLISNAADAIGDAHGTITVSTDTIVVREGGATHYLPSTPFPGPHVRLRVTDSGQGMLAELIPNIFDPFFSTKSAGHGLGLSTVLGIVSSHDAVIGVESEPGVGTTMEVLFPIHEGVSASREDVAAPSAWCPGEGTVLVVDDEISVRLVAVTALTDAGYEVIQACDGEQALASLRSRGQSIRAVVLDVTMPNRDGHSTLRELRKTHPELPVLLSSGEITDVEIYQADARVRALHKPYTPVELTQAIAECLHT
jgi:PAS domain S-box-containing protein